MRSAVSESWCINAGSIEIIQVIAVTEVIESLSALKVNNFLRPFVITGNDAITAKIPVAR